MVDGLLKNEGFGVVFWSFGFARRRSTFPPLSGTR
jgi:hypothetical protein